MLLPLTDGLMKTTHFDDECRQLADRHYSRRTVGARQFAYSGRKLVLRDAGGLVLFVWMFPDPVNPGYCFKQAGWLNVRRPDGTIWLSAGGKHLLEKYL